MSEGFPIGNVVVEIATFPIRLPFEQDVHPLSALRGLDAVQPLGRAHGAPLHGVRALLLLVLGVALGTLWVGLLAL